MTEGRVARTTCPCRRATSPAEPRRETSRVASPTHDKVPDQAWSASCRPEQAGSLFHPCSREAELVALRQVAPRRAAQGTGSDQTHASRPLNAGLFCRSATKPTFSSELSLQTAATEFMKML